MKSKKAMKLKFLCGAMVAVAAMAGCSTKEDVDVSGEIRLGVASTTRTAVNSTEGLVEIGNNIGIYGIKTATHETPGVWTKAMFTEDNPTAGGLVMNNVKTTSIDADGTIHWADKYFYPFNAESGVQFYAYYPYDAAITAPTAEGAAPVSSFTIDDSGSTDVMYTTPATGWRLRTAAETQLKFQHALTQLTFAVSDPEKKFKGAKLTSIVITNANTTGKMDVATGTTSEWGTPGSLTLEGIPEGGVEFTEAAYPEPDGSGKQKIEGPAIMLEPGLSSVTAEVTVNDRKSNITIRPDAPATAFEAGKSYIITLTFKEQIEIGVSASVQPWEEGGTGSADVY